MISQGSKSHTADATPLIPDWLRSLIKAVRREGLNPKDERVKTLWELLRERNLLGRSLWLRAVLRRIWNRGLVARPRPRTTRRMIRLLRLWSILPPPSVKPVIRSPIPIRPLQPVTVRPLRPVAVRPLKPVTVKPAAQAATR
jgi:hypothetical protein